MSDAIAGIVPLSGSRIPHVASRSAGHGNNGDSLIRTGLLAESRATANRKSKKRRWIKSLAVQNKFLDSFRAPSRSAAARSSKGAFRMRS